MIGSWAKTIRCPSALTDGPIHEPKLIAIPREQDLRYLKVGMYSDVLYGDNWDSVARDPIHPEYPVLSSFHLSSRVFGIRGSIQKMHANKSKKKEIGFLLDKKMVSYCPLYINSRYRIDLMYEY